MKKKLPTFTLLFCFSILFSIPSFGQNAIYMGLKGGPNFASLVPGSSGKSQWNSDFSMVTGPKISVFFEFEISTKFSIQPEIVYNAEGGKRNGVQPLALPKKYVDDFQDMLHSDQDYVYADVNNSYQLKYINIPILAKLNLRMADNFKFFVQGGPFIGFLSRGKQKIQTDQLVAFLDKGQQEQIPPELVEEYLGSSLDLEVKAKKKVRSGIGNYGITGGLGFSYQMGLHKIFIEANGIYGLSNIKNINQRGNQRMASIAIMVGYAYDIWD